MPGVTIRIARESTTSPMGYETLIEADSDNTEVKTKSNRKEKIFFKLSMIIQIPMNPLKVNF